MDLIVGMFWVKNCIDIVFYALLYLHTLYMCLQLKQMKTSCIMPRMQTNSFSGQAVTDVHCNPISRCLCFGVWPVSGEMIYCCYILCCLVILHIWIQVIFASFIYVDWVKSTRTFTWMTGNLHRHTLHLPPMTPETLANYSIWTLCTAIMQKCE